MGLMNACVIHIEIDFRAFEMIFMKYSEAFHKLFIYSFSF